MDRKTLNELAQQTLHIYKNNQSANILFKAAECFPEELYLEYFGNIQTNNQQKTAQERRPFKQEKNLQSSIRT